MWIILKWNYANIFSISCWSPRLPRDNSSFWRWVGHGVLSRSSGHLHDKAGWSRPLSWVVWANGNMFFLNLILSLLIVGHAVCTEKHVLHTQPTWTQSSMNNVPYQRMLHSCPPAPCLFSIRHAHYPHVPSSSAPSPPDSSPLTSLPLIPLP